MSRRFRLKTILVNSRPTEYSVYLVENGKEIDIETIVGVSRSQAELYGLFKFIPKYADRSNEDVFEVSDRTDYSWRYMTFPFPGAKHEGVFNKVMGIKNNYPRLVIKEFSNKKQKKQSKGKQKVKTKEELWKEKMKQPGILDRYVNVRRTS